MGRTLSKLHKLGNDISGDYIVLVEQVKKDIESFVHIYHNPLLLGSLL